VTLHPAETVGAAAACNESAPKQLMITANRESKIVFEALLLKRDDEPAPKRCVLFIRELTRAVAVLFKKKKRKGKEFAKY